MPFGHGVWSDVGWCIPCARDFALNLQNISPIMTAIVTSIITAITSTITSIIAAIIGCDFPEPQSKARLQRTRNTTCGDWGAPVRLH